MMGVALTSKASVVYCLGVVVLVVLMWSGSTSGNGQSQKKSTEDEPSTSVKVDMSDDISQQILGGIDPNTMQQMSQSVSQQMFTGMDPNMQQGLSQFYQQIFSSMDPSMLQDMSQFIEQMFSNMDLNMLQSMSQFYLQMLSNMDPDSLQDLSQFYQQIFSSMDPDSLQDMLQFSQEMFSNMDPSMIEAMFGGPGVRPERMMLGMSPHRDVADPGIQKGRTAKSSSQHTPGSLMSFRSQMFPNPTAKSSSQHTPGSSMPFRSQMFPNPTAISSSQHTPGPSMPFGSQMLPDLSGILDIYFKIFTEPELSRILVKYTNELIWQLEASEKEQLQSYLKHLEQRINVTKQYAQQLKVGHNESGGLPEHLQVYESNLAQFTPLFEELKNQYLHIKPSITILTDCLKRIKDDAESLKADLSYYVPGLTSFGSHSGGHNQIASEQNSRFPGLKEMISQFEQNVIECKQRVLLLEPDIAEFEHNLTHFKPYLQSFEEQLARFENNTRSLTFQPNLTDYKPHFKPRLSTFFESDQPLYKSPFLEPELHIEVPYAEPLNKTDSGVPYKDLIWSFTLNIPLIHIVCHIIMIVFIMQVLISVASLLFFLSCWKAVVGNSNVNSTFAFICLSTMIYVHVTMILDSADTMFTFEDIYSEFLGLDDLLDLIPDIVLAFDILALLAFALFASVPGYYCTKFVLLITTLVHLSSSLLLWQTDNYYAIVYFILTVIVVLYILCTKQATVYAIVRTFLVRVYIAFIRQVLHHILRWTRSCYSVLSSSRCHTAVVILLENILVCLLPSRVHTIHVDRLKFNDKTYPVFLLILWQFTLVLLAVLVMYSSLSYILMTMVYYSKSRKRVNKTFYFREAEEKARVKFLYHHILKCDHNGLTYNIPGHGITLKFPKGVVDKWETLVLEIGVVMYGPFTFTGDAQPISPILWLCRLDESVVLKKKFEINLPHYLSTLAEDDVETHQIQYAKASHTPIANDNLTMYQYNFYPWETNFQRQFDTANYQNYGTLVTDHCCFCCLVANITPEIALSTGYCLVQIESTSYINDILRNNIHFAAIFFLETCMRALEVQFPPNEGYKICSWKYFRFKSNPNGEYLKLLVLNGPNSCVIGLEPSTAEIKANDINYWNDSLSTMFARHERKMYPPRVVMSVTMRSHEDPFKLPIRVDGCLSENQLDMDISFPLGSQMISSPLSISSEEMQFSFLRPSVPTITAVLKQNDLSVLLQELTPLASDWEDIGIFLGIDDGTLSSIKGEQQHMRANLREMLRTWLRRVEPQPTWTAMINAIEIIDQSHASRLRSRYCSRS